MTLTWKDSWNGFEAERTSIMKTLADVRRESETTVVTLTGDMHMTLATLLQNEDGTSIGVEFMTPSVTSVTFHEKIYKKIKEIASKYGNFMVLSVNSNAKGEVIVENICDSLSNGIVSWMIKCALIDSTNWGYSVIEFSRDVCKWDVYWVDKTVDSAETECKPVYRIRLPVDEYVIQERHGEVSEPGSVQLESK